MTGKEFKDIIVPLSARLYPMVARLLKNEEDAEDAIQDIMIKLWRNRKKIDNHTKPGAYIFLTAKNHCLDILKRRKPLVTCSNEYDLINYEGRQDNTIEGNEIFNIVREIVEGLPEKQKEIIVLRDIDGLEFTEIQAITGERPENISVYLSRARKNIGLKLKEIYNYEYGKTR